MCLCPVICREVHRPLLGFARLLRRFGFAIAPEQAIAFMQAVGLLGPRSMGHIRRAAVATFAPSPDRRVEFDALFESWFYGEAGAPLQCYGNEEEETEIKDEGDSGEDEALLTQEETGGELTSRAEQLGMRSFGG